MKELVGSRVFGVEIDRAEQRWLRFVTDRGCIAYWADGECFSKSWFADITGVDALQFATVLEVETISMDGYNVDDGRGRQDSDKAYGYKIRTSKGYASIVYRNSSNGFYGGSLELKLEVPPDVPMVEVRGDYPMTSLPKVITDGMAATMAVAALAPEMIHLLGTADEPILHDYLRDRCGADGDQLATALIAWWEDRKARGVVAP